MSPANPEAKSESASSGIGLTFPQIIASALAAATAAILGSFLGVLGTNARACTFYERQGFVVAGERRFLVGDTWHDDLVYARDI